MNTPIKPSDQPDKQGKLRTDKTGNQSSKKQIQPSPQPHQYKEANQRSRQASNKTNRQCSNPNAGSILPTEYSPSDGESHGSNDEGSTRHASETRTNNSVYAHVHEGNRSIFHSTAIEAKSQLSYRAILTRHDYGHEMMLIFLCPWSDLDHTSRLDVQRHTSLTSETFCWRRWAAFPPPPVPASRPRSAPPSTLFGDPALAPLLWNAVGTS